MELTAGEVEMMGEVEAEVGSQTSPLAEIERVERPAATQPNGTFSSICLSLSLSVRSSIKGKSLAFRHLLRLRFAAAAL